MKQLDIETYLEGELTGKALEAFESEMRNNPSFAQMVKRMSQLTDDLEMESLRNQVNDILKPTDNDPNKNQGPSPWWGLLVGLALLLVAGYYFMGEDEAAVAPTATPIENEERIPTNKSEEPVETKSIKTIEENKTIPETNTTKEKKQPPVHKKTKTMDSRPMAHNSNATNLPPPLHPSPNVRGQNEDNKEWKTMLDKIWYTDFPPIDATAPYSAAADLLKERDFKKAFVKLELLEMKSGATDTLRFLKGYCLLEMGEGGDALRYFGQIENPQKNWKATLQWYQALGTLTAKGVAEAIPTFKEIAKDKAHPFYLKSQKALDVLE